MERHEYNVNIEWDKDRIGTLKSPELKNSIQVATPPQFPGGVPEIWSPEHLFTSSILSCFMITFLAIAEFSKLEYTGFNCKAKGILEKPDGRYRMTKVELDVTLDILREVDIEKAKRVLEKSEKACLISNSVNSQIELLINIKVIS